jgi:hypothetical protein
MAAFNNKSLNLKDMWFLFPNRQSIRIRKIAILIGVLSGDYNGTFSQRSEIGTTEPQQYRYK